MADPFATVTQLRDKVRDPSLSTSLATLVLEDVSDDIRNGLGWSVTEEAGRVLTLDGSGMPLLMLPTMHLTAVASVVEDGVTLTFGTQFDWLESGVLRRLASSPEALMNWTCKPRSVVATITHGYPAGQVPGIFRTVCLDYSSAAVANPVSARSLQIGGVTQSHDPRTMLGAAKAGEDPRLDRYWIKP